MARSKRLTISIIPINELQLIELARRRGCSEAEAIRQLIELAAAEEGIAAKRTEEGYELVNPPE